MSTTTLRGQALVLAARLLSAIGAITPPVRVTVECPGTRIEFTALAGELEARAPPPGLSPLERRVLAAATHEPQTAKRLAGRLHRPCNSYFRNTLRSLCRRDLLQLTPDGYRLPDQPLYDTPTASSG